MKERWVVCIIDEGYPNFHLTEDEEAFRSVEAAANESDEEAMERFYEEGLQNSFEEGELDGVTVLGLTHFHTY